MKKIMILLCICVIMISLNKEKNEVLIPDEAIRFRVIANSNQAKDQQEKKKIAKQLSSDIEKVLTKTKSISEARKTLQNNISHFEECIKKIETEDQYYEKINIDYGNHYFPQKEYKGVTYKEGEYESLVVTLGQGQGENFWCVLFPPLCLLEADEQETDEIKYSSFIKELIDKYF